MRADGAGYDSRVRRPRQRPTRWLPSEPRAARRRARRGGRRGRGRRRRPAALAAVERGRPEPRAAPADGLVRPRRAGRATATTAAACGRWPSSASRWRAAGRDRRRPARRPLAPGRGARRPRARPGGRGSIFGVGLSLVTFAGGAAAVGGPLRLGPRLRHRHAGRRRAGCWTPAKGLGMQARDRGVLGRRGGGADRPRAAALVGRAGGGGRRRSSTCSSLLSPLAASSRSSSAPSRCAIRRCRPRSSTWRTAPGWSADDVKVNDASARTTAANAYVSGLGAQPAHRPLRHPAARLPARPGAHGGGPRAGPRRAAPRAEGLRPGARPWPCPACLLVFAVVGWRTGFGRAGRDAAGCDLVLRRLAIAAAAAAVISARARPLANWVSRAYEREADWRGLQLSRDPAADIGAAAGADRSAAWACPTRPRCDPVLVRDPPHGARAHRRWRCAAAQRSAELGRRDAAAADRLRGAAAPAPRRAGAALRGARRPHGGPAGGRGGRRAAPARRGPRARRRGRAPAGAPAAAGLARRPRPGGAAAGLQRGLRRVARARMDERPVAFVVGGASASADLVAECDERLSLGPLTMPHQLARVVLAEQLYRALCIASGTLPALTSAQGLGQQVVAGDLAAVGASPRPHGSPFTVPSTTSAPARRRSGCTSPGRAQRAAGHHARQASSPAQSSGSCHEPSPSYSRTVSSSRTVPRSADRSRAAGDAIAPRSTATAR